MKLGIARPNGEANLYTGEELGTMSDLQAVMRDAGPDRSLSSTTAIRAELAAPLERKHPRRVRIPGRRRCFQNALFPSLVLSASGIGPRRIFCDDPFSPSFPTPPTIQIGTVSDKRLVGKAFFTIEKL